MNTLTVKTKIPCFLTIASGLLNVGSMYVLLKYTNLGAYAVVLTTVVIMTIMNLTFNPIYSAKCLNESPAIFYSVIIRHLVSVVIMSGVFLDDSVSNKARDMDGVDWKCSCNGSAWYYNSYYHYVSKHENHEAGTKKEKMITIKTGGLMGNPDTIW